MRLLTRRFYSAFGHKYRPGCLLVKADARSRVLDSDALVSFRNMCAIATTTQGWGTALASMSGHRSILWNDSFQFGFYTPGRSGGYVFLHGAVWGFESADRMRRMRLHPASQFESLRTAAPDVDVALLGRLMTAWRRYYVQKRERRRFEPLFRSLATAFHAGLFPSDGITVLSDAGTRIGQWVSAFEVLFHPGIGGRVDKDRVMRELASGPWDSSVLVAKRYTVRVGHKVKRRATLLERIYEDLYDARNAFLHGNRVTQSTVRFRGQRNRLSLVELVPSLYHGALLAFLEGKVGGGPSGRVRDLRTPKAVRTYMQRRDGLSNVQQALMHATQT